MTLVDSPYTHILIPIALTVIVNAVVRPGSTGYTKNPWIPPGYIVGAVWTLLFGILGYTHYLLYRKGLWQACMAVEFLLLFYILYPFLHHFSFNMNGLDSCLCASSMRKGVTNRFRNEKMARALNQISLLLTLFVTAFLYNLSFPISYMIPVLLWLTYVNIVTL